MLTSTRIFWRVRMDSLMGWTKERDFTVYFSHVSWRPMLHARNAYHAAQYVFLMHHWFAVSFWYLQLWLDPFPAPECTLKRAYQWCMARYNPFVNRFHGVVDHRHGVVDLRPPNHRPRPPLYPRTITTHAHGDCTRNDDLWRAVIEDVVFIGLGVFQATRNAITVFRSCITAHCVHRFGLPLLETVPILDVKLRHCVVGRWNHDSLLHLLEPVTMTLQPTPVPLDEADPGHIYTQSTLHARLPRPILRNGDVDGRRYFKTRRMAYDKLGIIYLTSRAMLRRRSHRDDDAYHFISTDNMDVRDFQEAMDTLYAECDRFKMWKEDKPITEEE